MQSLQRKPQIEYPNFYQSISMQRVKLSSELSIFRDLAKHLCRYKLLVRAKRKKYINFGELDAICIQNRGF